LDRNLIIVVLYDSACAYQGLWQLEKCSKYLDGVIYNLETCLKDDDQTLITLKSSPRLSDYKANRIKKLKFLVLCNLQYSAILSQLAQHEKSYENAKKTWSFLVDMFHDCFEFIKELRRRHDQSFIMNKASIKKSSPSIPINKKISALNEPSEYNKTPNSNMFLINKEANNTNKQGFSSKKALGNHINPQLTQSQNHLGPHLNESSESGSWNKSPDSKNIIEGKLGFGKNNTVGFIKNEISFSKIVVDYAYPILEYITSLKTHEEISNFGKEMLSEVRKSLYFWKNNPENNEKHIRKELKLPIEKDEDSKRSLLGVADSTEWLETFNIGAIMHMNPITYEEFMFYGEIIYEVSKKLLLEKVIYFSVVLFTMATEIRFIEIEKAKLTEKKKGFEGSEIEGNKKNALEFEALSAGIKTS